MNSSGAILDCGGKRSATPLLLQHESGAPNAFRLAAAVQSDLLTRDSTLDLSKLMFNATTTH